MVFHSTKFGPIDVNLEDVIDFSNGLSGFLGCTQFILVEIENITPFRVLQSLDDPEVTLIVLDPSIARYYYMAVVTLDDLKLVNTERVGNVKTYSIVTMNRDICKITINLREPLIVNFEEGLGYQLAMLDTSYTTQDRLLWARATELQGFADWEELMRIMGEPVESESKTEESAK